MLASAKELLSKAKKGKYGIIAPDFLDLHSARVFVNTANELNTPILLSFAQAHKHILALEEAALIGKFMAESVDVPIALHLDHGEDFDYIKRAIRLGFNSVMIDASMHGLAENIRITKEIADYAHLKGVSIEAEIGHVGGSTESPEGVGPTDSVYTTVEEARTFVEQTQVDSLAVSIGTAHGVYKNNKNPQLNFERLKELATAIDIPLVLHGGSGTGDTNLKRCVTEGISKVNIFTEFTVAALKEIQETHPSSFVKLQQAADQGMKKVLTHYIELLSMQA